MKNKAYSLHSAIHAVNIANITNVKIGFEVIQFNPHHLLFRSIATENPNFLGIRIQKTGNNCPAKRTGSVGNKDCFSR
jgi:hypothetical protein